MRQQKQEENMTNTNYFQFLLISLNVDAGSCGPKSGFS